jgi:fructokinase
MKLYGAIEAGGTKFVCLVAREPANDMDFDPQSILAETRFATTTPRETLGKAAEFISGHSPAGRLAAVGMGSFGPLDLDPASPTFGRITTTPKPDWSGADIAGELSSWLQVPTVIDTDVNAAALGEYRWGAARGLDPSLYLTVGTGIGMGGIFGGRPMHGLVHPEAGHMRLPHDRQADPFPGSCPFHGDCFEGLASGSAMRERWGGPAESLPPGHPAWDLQAGYLALALANLILALSPRCIVLGGGVMKEESLYPRVRREVVRLLNGYIQSPAILEEIDRYILAPGLGERSGVLGALALALHHSGERGV